MYYKCVSKNYFGLIHYQCKMIQRNSVNINLADSQVNRLKPATKNSTEVTLKFLSNVWCIWCNYFPHKLPTNQ